MIILGGDIGGTHTRLALFDLVKEYPSRPQQVKTFSSRSYPGLQEIIAEYLKDHKTVISKACFGVAGTVHKGACQTTNLPWSIDSSKLGQFLGVPVFLLNDLEANAYGLRVLQANEFSSLQEGRTHQGNALLISAGTGLGESGLYWDGTTYKPFASEGGHADFAPKNQDEFELFLFLQKENQHVSYERVVSGPGLYAIYRFLIESGRERPCQAVESRDSTRDASRIVSEFGAAKRDPACQRALEWFAKFYGAAAGNAALHFLAVGGVYLGGGIAPNILGELQSGKFLESFLQKGRFRSLLQSIPVRVILNDQTALLGTAEYLRISHSR